MQHPHLLVLCAIAFARCRATVVTLESFDKPALTWAEHNDPIMGGQSTGTFAIKGSLGVFDGQVVNLPKPFPAAPGFIKVDSNGAFPDVSSCDSLVITARARADYKGFRVSFGTAHAPGGSRYAYGYKAHFDAPVGSDFADVVIPFTNFSDYWDSSTGLQIKTCQDNVSYCPDKSTLTDMKTLSVWGEGVGGDVHLEIRSIGAAGCSSLVHPIVEEAALSYPTIKELIAEQYIGRWYNLFANSYISRLFTGNKCVTGDYGAVANRSDAITVYNGGQIDLINSKFHTSGFATQSPNASEPGKFVVKQSVPFGIRPAPTEPPVYDTANYIIMDLGPVVDGKYEYSLITGGKNELFVLARDKDRFAEKYQKDVLEKLASWGFTGKAVPYATSQEDCNYRPLPPQASASDYKCPGSGSLVRAWAEVTATTSAKCADVSAEMSARASAKGGWVDPHNAGIYSVIASSDNELQTQRMANPSKSVGGKKYIDKQTFTFTDKDGGCQIRGCSESQGFSVGDFSTNYCDLRNLYCGTADGCSPVANDLTTKQVSVTKSFGAGKDWSKCVVKDTEEVFVVV